MQTVLIPIDGSKPCDAAVRRAIREVRLGQVERIHLVNVQPHLRAYVGRFVGKRPGLAAFGVEMQQPLNLRRKVSLMHHGARSPPEPAEAIRRFELRCPDAKRDR